MPKIIDKATLQKDGEFRSVIIVYYPELDVEPPMGQHIIKNPDQKQSPYRTLIYSGKSLTDEWQYSYEGRAGNRFFIEIGKLVVKGFQAIDVRQNVSRREYADS